MNTLDRSFEHQVYLPDERVPEAADTDLASEEPKADRGMTEARGLGRRATEETGPPEEGQGLDLLEDLAPYDLRTITRGGASLS